MQQAVGRKKGRETPLVGLAVPLVIVQVFAKRAIVLVASVIRIDKKSRYSANQIWQLIMSHRPIQNKCLF